MNSAFDPAFWDDLLSGLALRAEHERQNGDQASAIRLIQLLYDICDVRWEPETSIATIEVMLADAGVSFRARDPLVPEPWVPTPREPNLAGRETA